MINRLPEIEGQVAALRKEANSLPKKFWARKRSLRQEANDLAEMARQMNREMQRIY